VTYAVISNNEAGEPIGRIEGAYSFTTDIALKRMAIAFQTTMHLNSYAGHFVYFAKVIGNHIMDIPERDHPAELVLRQEMSEALKYMPKAEFLKMYANNFHLIENLQEVFDAVQLSKLKQ
jgi:hypothetical protein